MTSHDAENKATSPRPLPRAWLIVALLWGVGCLNYLDRLMLTTMRDSIKAAIPMGDDDFGLLTTMFLWVYGLLSPVGGWLADRYGRSRIILVSLIAWSLVTWATSCVQTFPQLLATRAIMGISEACYIPAALALIADYHRGATRSFATGLHMSGLYAGAALGGMGGWMAERHGWASGFFVFGCVGVIYACVLLALLRDVPHAPQESRLNVPLMETLRALGSSRAFWFLAAFWGLLGFAGWGFVAWMPTFLRERFQLTQSTAGFTATAWIQCAAFLGVLGGGAWADRWSRTSLRGRVAVPMIALILAAPVVWLTAHADALWVAIIGLVAFGLGRGCADANMMPILCQVAAPRHRATGYGLLNLFSCGIGGVAAYLGGWCKEQRMDLAWLMSGCALLVLLSALALLAVKPTRAD